MKNTIRVRHNTGKARSTRQAKTRQKNVTIVFYDVQKDRELCRVDLPEIAYAAMLRHCKKQKITLENFVVSAITEMAEGMKSEFEKRGAK
jgi:hypothetical protein